MKAKRDSNIKAIEFPRYSPDLNPLDFFIWAEVQRRMAQSAPSGKESFDAYKARLKATAMAIPKAAIRSAVSNMKAKAAEVVAAKGGKIASD